MKELVIHAFKMSPLFL